jgi:hypothetical protein
MGRFRLLPARIVLISFLLHACSSSPKPLLTNVEKPHEVAGSGIPPEAQPRLRVVLGRLERLADEDWAFWKTHGPDREHGGFHGTLDHEGDPGIVAAALSCS